MACFMCDNADTNPELRYDIDLHYTCIDEYNTWGHQAYRLLFRTGGDQPTVILAELWRARKWEYASRY